MDIDFNIPTIITKRNVDSGGNPISVKLIEIRQIMDNYSCVVLSQTPDEYNRIYIEGFTEVFDIEKLDKKNFKVDYSQGIIYFHPFNIGKAISIEYYGTGYELISASRVFTKVDKYGNVIDTLEEILNRASLQLKLIESLDGAIKVIEKLDEDIKNANNLNAYFDEMIPEATGLKNELDTIVTDAKGWKDQLKQDVADGKVLQPLLHNDVIQGREVKQQLDQSIADAQDDIAKIEATGNEIVYIISSEWVYNNTSKMYEKQITHTCNSENIHVTCKTSDTKEALFLPWKIVDKSNILLKSDEAINVSVVISASYYKALEDNTTTQEVIDARKGELTLLDKINSIDTQLYTIKNKVKYNEFRYVSTTFKNEDMKLFVMGSNDGINWTVFNHDGSYSPSTGNKNTLRDPSLVQIGEWFYLVYTRIDWGTGNYIGFAKTKDFENFIELNNLEFNGFEKIWAPEFFHDVPNNRYYVCFSGDIVNGEIDNFNSFYQEISLGDSVNKIGSHIKFSGYGEDMNRIDVSVFYDNNRYYYWFKDETSKNNYVCESFVFGQNLVKIQDGLFTNYEGIQMIKIENGYRIYADMYEDESIKLSYCDTYDWFNSFTPMRTLVTHGHKFSHNYVLDRNPLSKEMQYSKSFLIVKNRSTIVIPNNSNKNLTFDTLIRSADFAMTEDKEKAIIGSDGVYLIIANIGWSANPNGYRNIAIEHRTKENNYITGKAVAISQVQAVQGEQTQQSISAIVYCNYLDQISVNVKQTSGGDLSATEYFNSPVLNIVKLS